MTDLAAEREARIRAEARLDGYREAMAEALAAIGGRCDTAAERRRAYDRERKRPRNPPESTGTPPPSFPSSFPPSSTPSSSYPLSFPPSPETSLAASPEAEKPSELRALWNAEADPRLPRWKDLTDKRAKQAAARLSERPLAEWRIILGRINASPFCLGENERGWKADVEFFLRPDTATRVLEGKYDPSVRPGAKHVLPKADDPGWVTS